MFIRIYALAICFTSMLCIAISTGVALYDLVQLGAPQLTVDSYQYPMHRAMIQFAPGPMMINEAGQARRPEPMSEEEIAAEEQRQLAGAIEQERQGALRSLLQILTILLVSVPLYIVHWRLAKRLDATSTQV